MKRGFIALMCLGLALGAMAQAPAPKLVPVSLRFPPESGTYRVLVLEVIDGDTVRFAFLVEDVGRLAGINAPELHGDSAAAGQASKAFLAKNLSPKPMVCVVKGREKYGRTLIELFGDDGKSLSTLMVEAGQAKSWNGEGQRP